MHNVKRGIATAMIATMVVGCFGCGKDEYVKQVEQKIANLGEVSLESGEAIEDAELYYNALNDNQKNRVKNHPDLALARSNYDKLIEQEAERIVAEEEKKKEEEEKKKKAAFEKAEEDVKLIKTDDSQFYNSGGHLKNNKYLFPKLTGDEIKEKMVGKWKYAYNGGVGRNDFIFSEDGVFVWGKSKSTYYWNVKKDYLVIDTVSEKYYEVYQVGEDCYMIIDKDVDQKTGVKVIDFLIWK